jgi:hypothetical protein
VVDWQGAAGPASASASAKQVPCELFRRPKRAAGLEVSRPALQAVSKEQILSAVVLLLEMRKATN